MTIAVTMGDPAGVGPEICLKTLSRLKGKSDIILIGDYSHLLRIQKKIFRKPFPDVPTLDLNILNGAPIRFGYASALAGRASGEYIKKAVELASAGLVDAIVTAPINKISFLMGGWGRQYVGHTEMLAALTNARTVRSMLACDAVRAVHVTSHIPLRKVASTLTIKSVTDTILLAFRGLKQLGIQNPRIGVAGLNPHAGDNGVLGNEERKIILPAIKTAQKVGINVQGPVSADALWPLVNAKKYDAGVAMYHDQGQIPVKFKGFLMGKNGQLITRGIQITLGLPFVRVSVDHGTAYDIAGKGVASEESLIEAIQTARRMVKNV